MEILSKPQPIDVVCMFYVSLNLELSDFKIDQKDIFTNNNFRYFLDLICSAPQLPSRDKYFGVGLNISSHFVSSFVSS